MLHSTTSSTISSQVISNSRNRNHVESLPRGQQQVFYQDGSIKSEQLENSPELYEAETRFELTREISLRKKSQAVTGKRQHGRESRITNALTPSPPVANLWDSVKENLSTGNCENVWPALVSVKMEMSTSHQIGNHKASGQGGEQQSGHSMIISPLQNGRDNNEETNTAGTNQKMSRNGRAFCAGCQAQIRDKFIFSVIDQFWHQDCVQCADCSLKLSDRCYTLNGKLYCKLDYWHRFGPKCFACQQTIDQSELVQRIKSNRVYHLKCFTCNECRRPLEQGEQLHLVDDRNLLCKQDFQRLSSRCRSSGSIVGGENGCNNATNNPNIHDIKQDLGDSNGNDDDGEHVHHHDGRLATVDTELLLNDEAQDQEFDQDDQDEDEENRLNGQRHSLTSSHHLKAEGELQANIKMEQQQPIKQQQKLNPTTTTNTGNSATAKFEPSDLGQDDLIDANGKRRGPRTTIKPKQLETLRHAFESAPKPSRHIREQLSQETGLAMRVIQVWFQNRRSKERRMRNSNGSARRNFLRSQSRRLRVGTQTIVSLPAAPGSGLGQSLAPTESSLISSTGSGNTIKTEGGARTANGKQSKGSTSASSASSTTSSGSAVSRQRGSTSPADKKKSNQSLNDFSSSIGQNSGSGFTYYSDSSNQGTESSFAALTNLSGGGSTGVTCQQQKFSQSSNGIIQQHHSPPESVGSLTPTGGSGGGGGATSQTNLMGVESPSGAGTTHSNGAAKSHQSTNQQQQQQQQYQSSPGMKNTPPPAPIYQQAQMHNQFLGTPPQQHHSMGHPQQLMSNSHHQMQQQPPPPHHFQHLHEHPHQHPTHQMTGVPNHHHHHHHHQMLQPGPMMNSAGSLPAGLMSSHHQSQAGPPSVVQW